ncbi:urease accessory protein UreD [Caenimonas terrae]|uniref:Urease accessory protein UreD n=1 Tax=Caenimonas terrae TaxID=696074 RepID=A0ABW0NAL5_9BURK
MPWHARLQLDYRMEAGRCVGRFEHDGPLRILQSLYPEGDAICHNVVVHPPGGLVGGDTLEIAVRAGEGAHGLITTPGATRFYRSDGEPALQATRLELEAGARMEWLPLEAICYSGCLAENRLRMELAPGSELIGWDVTALGLPEAGQPFERGTLLQHLELPGHWLERGRIDSADARLLDGPLGLDGKRCLATLFLVAGSDIPRPRRELALELARGCIEAHPLAASAGATAPGPRVIAVRVLAPLVEPALALLKAVRACWRTSLWELPPTVPRSWAL